MPPGPDSVSSEDCEISVDGGSIRARILRPSAQARSVMVYYHGGGWVIGNIDDYDAGSPSCGNVQRSCGDGRLPKGARTRLPAPVNDCYAALEWVDAQRSQLGIDLPLVVARQRRWQLQPSWRSERGMKAAEIALQALIYPVTDGRMGADSFTHEDKQLFLTTDIMAFFWDHYADQRRVSIQWRRPLTESLQGLPRLVLTAEFDILVDEGRAYAEHSSTGVSVFTATSRSKCMAFAMPAPCPRRQSHELAGTRDGSPQPHRAQGRSGCRGRLLGMYQLYKLREQGLDVQIFEAGTT